MRPEEFNKFVVVKIFVAGVTSGVGIVQVVADVVAGVVVVKVETSFDVTSPLQHHRLVEESDLSVTE